MGALEAISPLDGRYRRYTEALADIFSEKGLIQRRVKVEGEYLIFLSEHPQIGLREFSEKEKKLVRRLYDISTENAGIVKAIEVNGYRNVKPTNHDVKAIEYFMRDRLKGTSLEDSLDWIHFALTSEDVNNLAYGLMLSTGVGEIVLPSVQRLYETIEESAQRYKDVPMLARTHGQPASPTTFGKEFKVFASRMKRQLDQLAGFKILVKLNGATGNYDAHHASYPKVDWLEFTRDFVERFNERRRIRLEPNFVTTQIEPHDTYAELFDNLRRLNTIVIGFDQDMLRYISDDWVRQKPVEGEIGSSTMPHKVNPIDFENSEGNLGIANALFGYFSSKLPVSRLQRDLSDSTVERNFGVALGHSLIGYNSKSL
ncbi:adenylosuccinate lyase [Candidatus Woesearchaeota archaeon]|nr:adenylosuccinate lyase [Candidatus Woesearchaeota archaeon]